MYVLTYSIFLKHNLMIAKPFWFKTRIKCESSVNDLF